MPVERDTREFDEEEERYGAEHYVDSALLASIASGGTFDVRLALRARTCGFGAVDGRILRANVSFLPLV